jgi:hypothetical protein
MEKTSSQVEIVVAENPDPGLNGQSAISHFKRDFLLRDVLEVRSAARD